MALGGRTVTAPDGSTWHVGRQWMPWKPRHRGPDVDAGDMGGGIGDLGGDDIVGLVIGLLVLVAIVFLLFTVVIPLVALAVEIILLVIMLLWGIGMRVLLRRPWTVRAREQDGARELVYKAKGFARAGRVRDEVAEAIARGEIAPRPAEALPA
jgi:hypothetical protein